MERDITKELLSAMQTPIGDVLEWVNEAANTARAIGDRVEETKNLDRLVVLTDLVQIILQYKKADINWTPRKEMKRDAEQE